MRTVKPFKRSEPGPAGTELHDESAEFPEEEPEIPLVRVLCPDCARPVALADPEGALPRHAVCPTPWNPFGLTLCPGSGRAASGGSTTVLPAAPAGRDTLVLAALPDGLDWRLQPFSHAAPVDARLPQAA